MNTTYNSKSHSNNTHLLVRMDKVAEAADQIPKQTAEDDHVFPVKLINLVPHDHAKDGVCYCKHCTTHDAVL